MVTGLGTSESNTFKNASPIMGHFLCQKERTSMNELQSIAAHLHTANLIAVHQASNLVLNDADRLELEQQILKRIGIHDA